MNSTKQETIRVTVPVTAEVKAVFEHLSQVSGVSVGKAMGTWLSDTSSAALQMAEIMVQARQQPKMVADRLHGYALGLSEVTADLLEHIKGRESTVTPPVSNTGGKLPQKPKTVGVRNSKKQGGSDAKSSR